MKNNKLKLKSFWKNKRVFITGHTGFKGSWMSIILNMLEANIYGYSLKPNKKSLFNQAKCKNFIKKNFYNDINDLKTLENKIIKCKPNILFHLAAQPLVGESYINPLNTFKTNILGTANILNAARKVSSLKSIVIITTDKVYKIKNSNKSYKEFDELGGEDPYSASKACAEFVTNSFISSFFKSNKNIKKIVSTARSGNVIGGGDYSKSRLLPDIIKSINTNKKLVIRNPKNIRPWQHVIEPTFGYLRLAEKQYKQKTSSTNPNWNFGPNKSNFVRVVDIIKILKINHKINYKVSKKQVFSETKILKLDNTKAKKFLNHYPKWNLTESLNKVLEWNIESRNNKSIRMICEDQIEKYLK